MPTDHIRIGDWTPGGRGTPLLVSEIGVNHEGSPETAHRLITAAANAGADAVKMQVGDPTWYVNPSHWSKPRDTPWGRMPYIEYRQRMEFSDDDYRDLRAHAENLGLVWFASALEEGAVDRLERMDVACHKVASPMLTHDRLLARIRETGKPVLMSTGMSTLAEIDHAVDMLDTRRLVLLHCTSAYPCPPDQTNLRMVTTLADRYGVPVGYSGHEQGHVPTLGAVALGACVIERHFTLDRGMWGSDQKASLEPTEFRQMAEDVKRLAGSMGDGRKRTYESEQANKRKFRKSAHQGAKEAVA